VAHPGCGFGLWTPCLTQRPAVAVQRLARAAPQSAPSPRATGKDAFLTAHLSAGHCGERVDLLSALPTEVDRREDDRRGKPTARPPYGCARPDVASGTPCQMVKLHRQVGRFGESPTPEGTRLPGDSQIVDVSQKAPSNIRKWCGGVHGSGSRRGRSGRLLEALADVKPSSTSSYKGIRFADL
jgi:hypothetical protein